MCDFSFIFVIPFALLAFLVFCFSLSFPRFKSNKSLVSITDTWISNTIIFMIMLLVHQ